MGQILGSRFMCHYIFQGYVFDPRVIEHVYGASCQSVCVGEAELGIVALTDLLKRAFPPVLPFYLEKGILQIV